MHSEEAFEFLVQFLSDIPVMEGTSAQQRRNNNYGGDLWIPFVAWAYWRPRQGGHLNDLSELDEKQFLPFYDAAWELCRIGVLRPGKYAPRGQSLRSGDADSYSITQFGRTWLQEASKRPIIDQSRLAQVLQTFASHFGDGYAQRATEAVSTYRTANYLAACVMAGAAAESILLAIAIRKVGNEAKVLAEYNTSGGRRRITKRVTNSVTPAIATQFETALQVLHYWRDNAGHGTMTTISEIEAHASLTQLLRLAQFASDHWTQLIT
jgi:hypothetical protein